jgi:hypothetical protein
MDSCLTIDLSPYLAVVLYMYSGRCEVCKSATDTIALGNRFEVLNPIWFSFSSRDVNDCEFVGSPRCYHSDKPKHKFADEP